MHFTIGSIGLCLMVPVPSAPAAQPATASHHRLLARRQAALALASFNVISLVNYSPRYPTCHLSASSVLVLALWRLNVPPPSSGIFASPSPPARQCVDCPTQVCVTQAANTV